MIAEHREPKLLPPDAIPILDFMMTQRFKNDAKRGSAKLRDAVLRLHGIIIPGAPRKPRPRKVDLCPTCMGPVKMPPRMIAGIQHAVASYYGFHPSLMTSDARQRDISHARQIAMFLSSELTRHSIAEIGRRFKKDHTTVLHACKAVKARMETDAETLLDVEVLRDRLAA
jgi:hypothetical protein